MSLKDVFSELKFFVFLRGFPAVCGLLTFLQIKKKNSFHLQRNLPWVANNGIKKSQGPLRDRRSERAREKRASTSQLALVLYLIGLEDRWSFLYQSQRRKKQNTSILLLLTLHFR